MLWGIVDKVVTLLTLVALVLMITIIFTNSRSSQDFSLVQQQIAEYKIENQNIRANNIAYLEKRINKLQEQQDTYQILTDRRFVIMEAQVKNLLEANKNNQKIITNNINNNSVGNITAR